ncbi:hypothetical protein H072_1206 [Dactylellina haptotyla CBS 200.50]|uniref:Uncharacterized protein n=1 Tax=Dactylellina haptotyla (strain CBS 200.50) TaxID=1284197 RepID=S8APB2_DACHA|nr:hypothetical protein H072_1206 [Dactylellina haptotyla CBS 200.50]
MSVFNTIKESLRRPSAVEISRSSSVASSQNARILSQIGTPSDFDRNSTRHARTISTQSLRPLTMSNLAEFDKRLPSPPQSQASSIMEVKESLWRKVARLNIQLDTWAKFIIVLSFCEAVMAFWAGLQILLAGRMNYGKIWTAMTIVLLVWGCFFVAVGYCGFSILWGRFSCSPTALKIMRKVATLLTVLYGTACGLWFFYGFQSATKTREMCVTTLIFWDGETLPAPQPWVDLCLETAQSFERLQIAWGFMNAFQVYFMMILVQWSGQHERELRQQKRWSRNSGLAYTHSDNSFERLSDMESNTPSSEGFERIVAEKVEEFARQEKIEKQTAKTVEIGMKIPAFPMPNMGNRTRTRLTLLNTPSPILETSEEATKDGFPRFSSASGAIPIALDLRNLDSPRFYGRAF